VTDPADLSSSSRFFAGGVGGITSQFSIYGLETLKTRIQSEVGPAQGMKAVVAMARQMWRAGGVRAYYRGLTVSRSTIRTDTKRLELMTFAAWTGRGVPV